MVILKTADSRIHGQGVFACSDIKKGEFIIEYEGERISSLAAQVRDAMYARSGVTFLFNVDDRTVIDGGVQGNIARFINHSCEPNCETRIEERRVMIYAQKDIKKGDELTFDYKFRKNSMREYCRCGSESCRGYINEL
jgi:histone-lysine N-methyltransferase SETD1